MEMARTCSGFVGLMATDTSQGRRASASLTRTMSCLAASRGGVSEATHGNATGAAAKIVARVKRGIGFPFRWADNTSGPGSGEIHEDLQRQRGGVGPVEGEVGGEPLPQAGDGQPAQVDVGHREGAH